VENVFSCRVVYPDGWINGNGKNPDSDPGVRKRKERKEKENVFF
jgi:hypothetical protein